MLLEIPDREALAPVITIDGPSGTGKGTLCHLLAKALHWHVLDSGHLYRVLAFAAEKRQLPLNDVAVLAQLACDLDVYFQMDPDQKQQVFLDAQPILEDIRTETYGKKASILAVIPEVRAALLERQRAFLRAPGLVTDGRDMGTVVFPQAFLKIYLNASVDVRAERRYFQLKQKGIDVSLPEVLAELVARDERDSQRACAPLKPAEDAILLDTSGMTVAQALAFVLKLATERLAESF